MIELPGPMLIAIAHIVKIEPAKQCGTWITLTDQKPIRIELSYEEVCALLGRPSEEDFVSYKMVGVT